MKKNPSKATEFYYDTLDCKSHSKCFLERGWLAKLMGYKVSLAGVFHHIYPSRSFNATGKLGVIPNKSE